MSVIGTITKYLEPTASSMAFLETTIQTPDFDLDTRADSCSSLRTMSGKQRMPSNNAVIEQSETVWKRQSSGKEQHN